MKWTYEYGNDVGSNDDYFVEFYEINDERGKLVGRAETEPFASLMADAPALLDALKIMTELAALKYGNLDADVFSEIEKARALIAKHGGGV